SFLKGSDLSASWEMRVDGRICEDLYAQLATVSFEPKAVSEKDTNLCAAIQEEDEQIYYGLCWNREVNEEFPIKELQELRETLAGRDFTSGPPWWIGWQWTDYGLREKGFLIRMAE